jgi:hypothetical protein
MRLSRKIAAVALVLVTPLYGANFAFAGLTGVPIQTVTRPKIVLPLIGGTPTGVTGLQIFGNAANALPFPINSATTKAPVAGHGIQFHGGKVMNDPNGVNVYIVWYGNWGSDTAKTIIPTFIRNLSNTPRFNTNTTYSDINGVALTGKINLIGEYSYPTTTLGTSLSDANVATLASGSLGHGTIPAVLDPNGIYLVLTAVGISQGTPGSAFLAQYCGWHDSTNMNNPTPVAEAQNMKYSFVGNAGTNSGCVAQTAASPNNNPGADGMLSVITHELEEAITDPDGTGWWDAATGMENSDKCAWTWGTRTTSVSNLPLGSANIVSATNNSALTSATVTGITNNSASSTTSLARLVSSNATATRAGTTITFTTTVNHSIARGDLVTVNGGIAIAPYPAVSSAAVTATTANTFTVAAAMPSRTTALTLTPNLAVSSVRAGTTATFTNSGTNAFAVGNLVSIAGAPAPYNFAPRAITARTATSFTVSLPTTTNDPKPTSQSLVASVARAGTTVTYTVSGTPPFRVGDLVTIASSVPAYVVSAPVAITAVSGATFTISKSSTAGTAALTVASTATGSRTISSSYNMTVNGANYLIQQNWANRAPNGVCAMS